MHGEGKNTLSVINALDLHHHDAATGHTFYTAAQQQPTIIRDIHYTLSYVELCFYEFHTF